MKQPKKNIPEKSNKVCLLKSLFNKKFVSNQHSKLANT